MEKGVETEAERNLTRKEKYVKDDRCGVAVVAVVGVVIGGMCDAYNES